MLLLVKYGVYFIYNVWKKGRERERERGGDGKDREHAFNAL